MSDLPRFENVDLTPTWNDVDPAELDFGGGAVGPEPMVDVLDADGAALNPQPIPPDVDSAEDAEDAELDVPADPSGVEDDVDVELPPAVETPMDDEPVDDFAGLDDADMQFDDGPIGADSVPDDFDL